ncbi:Helicase MOV-10 [Homalodisca vitripennis]|nr:Helicase MOV-10 [Homalodisca vitripennis]
MRKVHHSPFLLFGPPGTGKTTTLIEIIVQVWYKSQRRQLICGPSNAACDFLMQRLIAALPDAKIYRLFSKSATCQLLVAKHVSSLHCAKVYEGVPKKNRNCIAGSRQRVVHIPAAMRVSRNPLRAQ